MEKLTEMVYGGSYNIGNYSILARNLYTYEINNEGEKEQTTIKRFPSVFKEENKLMLLTEENSMLRWKVIPYDESIYKQAKAHGLTEIEFVPARSCFDKGDFHVAKSNYHKMRATSMQQKPMTIDIACVVEQLYGETWHAVPSLRKITLPEEQYSQDGLPKTIIAYFGPDGDEHIIPFQGNEHMYEDAKSRKLAK